MAPEVRHESNVAAYEIEKSLFNKFGSKSKSESASDVPDCTIVNSRQTGIEISLGQSKVVRVPPVLKTKNGSTFAVANLRQLLRCAPAIHQVTALCSVEHRQELVQAYGSVVDQLWPQIAEDARHVAAPDDVFANLFTLQRNGIGTNPGELRLVPLTENMCVNSALNVKVCALTFC